MNRAWLLVGFWAASLGGCSGASAQSHIGPPFIGLLRDSHRQVRRVFGITGNFIVGEAEASGVISMAFSGRAGLAKTEDSLLLLNQAGAVVRRLSAPPGAALFAFTANGNPALCYFPKTAELWRCAGDPSPAPSVHIEGNVMAIAAPSHDRVRLVLSHADRVWLVTASVQTGSILEQEPLFQVKPPVLLLSDGRIVSADGHFLRIRAQDGTESQLALPSPARELDWLGDGWVQVHVSGKSGVLALKLTQGGERVFEMPAGELPAGVRK